MAKKFRLIETGPCNPFENMAIDEVLLNSYRTRRVPVLRFYGWRPSAFSVGRFQDTSHVLKVGDCDRDRVPFVRRMTGGGAIYHTEEITYSLVCGQGDIGDGLSVKDSYRRLTSFLISFYRMLGVEAEYAADYFSGEKLGAHNPFCYAGKEEADIVVCGKKIGGNAQRRFRDTVFQHGSIPLRLQYQAAARYLREMPAGVEHSTTSLEQCGVRCESDWLFEIMAASFSQTMGADLVLDTLTLGEQYSVETILNGKYLRKDWNLTPPGDPGHDHDPTRLAE